MIFAIVSLVSIIGIFDSQNLLDTNAQTIYANIENEISNTNVNYEYLEAQGEVFKEKASTDQDLSFIESIADFVLGTYIFLFKYLTGFFDFIAILFNLPSLLLIVLNVGSGPFVLLFAELIDFFLAVGVSTTLWRSIFKWV